jgi:hypothetical protein
VTSWPIVEQDISTDQWRAMQGGTVKGIVDDRTGSSYKLTLSSSSNDIQLGSATVQSDAQVAGYHHRLNAGEIVTLSSPTPTSDSRVDYVTLRFDPTLEADAAGPIHPFLLQGIEGADAPDDDVSPPGNEDLILYCIVRQKNAPLSSAEVIDMRSWAGRDTLIANPTTGGYLLPDQAVINDNVLLPMGAAGGARWGHWKYLLVNGTPQWVRMVEPGTMIRRYKGPFLGDPAQPLVLAGPGPITLAVIDLADTQGTPYCVSVKANFEMICPAGSRWDVYAFVCSQTPMSAQQVADTGVGIGNTEGLDGRAARLDLVAPPSMNTFNGPLRVVLIAGNAFKGPQNCSITPYFRDFWVHTWAATLD